MYRFLLAPRWLALHAAVVVAGIACALLGWWQLNSYRHHDPPATPAAAAPAPLASVVGPGRPFGRDAAGRTVAVAGRYDAAQQLLVPGRELEGREGLYVLTPLVTAEGAVVPVRRGWVPSPDDPAVPPPAGEVTVRGVLRPSEPERSSGVRPDIVLPEGQSAVVATPELMRRWTYPPSQLYEGYVALAAQQPPAPVAPAVVPAEPLPPPGGVSALRNLSYAGQWWLFAGAAAIFWVLAVRSGVRERRPDGQRELLA